MERDIGNFEFIIIGAGIAGCKLFYHLTQFAPCILIDQQPPLHPYQRAKVICDHSLPWLSELNLGDGQTSQIPTLPHWQSMYASRESEIIIDGKEFGKRLSVVINEYDMRNWYLKNADLKASKCFWNSQCVHVKRSNFGIEIIIQSTSDHSEQKISGRCIILATGATGIAQKSNLHSQLHFSTPKLFNTISCTFQSQKSQLDKNLPFQYMYRLHSQISLHGMLYLNRFHDFFNIGYVDHAPRQEMEAKLIRILHNYKPIQPYLQSVTPKIEELSPSNFHFGYACKGILDNFVHDNAILIGDAGGFLYPMYFEGIVGAAASAQILADRLRKLFNDNQEYSEANLNTFQEELKRAIISKYFFAGQMADELFYEFGENPPYSIWEAYLQSMRKNQQVRKNIHTAYTCPDLTNYPLKNDFWVGEQLFFQLSPGKKIGLMPKFLKFKLKYSS